MTELRWSTRLRKRCFGSARKPDLSCATVCVVSLMVSCSQGKDADTSGVDHPQRLFPPDPPLLADMCRRFKTWQSHLPNLHYVSEISLLPTNVFKLQWYERANKTSVETFDFAEIREMIYHWLFGCFHHKYNISDIKLKLSQSWFFVTLSYRDSADAVEPIGSLPGQAR